MEVVKVKADKREEFGKAVTRRVRKEGLVPGVLYGGGEATHFVAEPLQFRELIYTPMLKICEVEINGKSYRCVVKDVQFHPVTDNIEHIDLQHLVDGYSIDTSVPLRTTGTPPGLQTGGKLIQKVRKVKIRTTPEYLVDELTVDVSHLDFKESVRIEDIDLPEGVKVRQNPQLPIATVDVPRVLRMPKLATEDELEDEDDEDMDEDVDESDDEGTEVTNE